MIECNWSEDIIIDNMCDNIEMRSRYDNHLELNDCISAIRANHNPFLQNVVLLHLSFSNSDENAFLDAVKSSIGINDVFVAKEGLTLELKKEKF